jgi:hypothetical protein
VWLQGGGRRWWRLWRPLAGIEADPLAGQRPRRPPAATEDAAPHLQSSNPSILEDLTVAHSPSSLCSLRVPVHCRLRSCRSPPLQLWRRSHIDNQLGECYEGCRVWYITMAFHAPRGTLMKSASSMSYSSGGRSRGDQYQRRKAAGKARRR